ncbi:MAG TPA: hypothetical protein VHS96_14850, partial [Bacteroidia bacterium]|nr:hypothetical protein [Bacteroidia bacterium]
MKFARILPSVFFLTCLLAMGCGEKTDSATAETPSQTTGKPHHGPGVMKQIPAAEVLGSTVKRNLRYQPEEETNAILPLDKYLEYIRQVGLSLRKEIGKLPAETPGSGTVVVGLNAAGENRAWYVFPDGQPSVAFKAAVQQ